ncbi:MAG: DnaJ C-terminal domain-containing protein, partial [Bradymonadaceae bacterium]
MASEDYYSILGVDRDASQEEIEKAYKRLAKKYHPDVNDEPGAEDEFKKVNEAYQVLKDPEKREQYDRFGDDWKRARQAQGQGAGPGWENVEVNVGGAGDFEDIFGGAGGPGGGGAGGAGGFGDFFETIFGGQGPGGGGRGPTGGRSQPGGGRRQGARARSPGGPAQGQSREAKVTVSLEDVYYGRERTVTLAMPGRHGGRERKTYTVEIPPGTTDGSKIRLAGEGEEGRGGGPAGDLLLEIEIAEHPVFEVDEYDLHTEVAISPWEAALGGEIEVPTVESRATVKVPAGSQSGRKLRLRGKGLPDDDGGR